MLRSAFAVAASAGPSLATAGTAVAESPVQFNAHWGGSGQTAYYHHENLCEKAEIEPSAGRRAELPLATHPFGQSVSKIYFDNPTVKGTLICAPQLDIWAATAGPWDPNAPGGANWLSIRCPSSEVPVDNGTGFWAPTRDLTQVAGGFGSRNDGYWHYRFHNWTLSPATIQFWAVCINPASKRPWGT